MPVNRFYTSGFSLSELLVAMALGLLLVSAALRAYTGIRAGAEVAEHRAALEERLQFALALLGQDIQLAGYWGLHASGTTLTPESTARVYCSGSDITPAALNLAQPLAAGTALLLPCPAAGNPLAGTHTLLTRHASPQPVAARSNRVQLQTGYSKGRVFGDGSVVNDGLERVHDVLLHNWFISRRSSEPPLPALRRLTLVQGRRIQNQEIMPGIVNMQIALGIDQDNDGTVDSLARPGTGISAEILTVHIELTARMPSGIDLPPLQARRTFALRNRAVA